MIAIIDYKAGNLASVSNALMRYDTDFQVTNRKEILDQADGIVFPGVGHAYSAMESLRELELVEWLRNTNKPLLGICVGMQLFYESTTEGPTRTLGIIPGHLKKFDSEQEKVPHMGWNNFCDTREHPLLQGLTDDDYLYYVHSYYAPENEYTVASCNYINCFSSVVQKDNFYGVQFHPEKSGKEGAKLLQNFLDIVYL